MRDVPELECMDFGDILDGTIPLSASHAGGEFQQFVEDLEKGVRSELSYVVRFPVLILFNDVQR
jgi:hypothetical protein